MTRDDIDERAEFYSSLLDGRPMPTDEELRLAFSLGGSPKPPEPEPGPTTLPVGVAVDVAPTPLGPLRAADILRPRDGRNPADYMLKPPEKP